MKQLSLLEPTPSDIRSIHSGGSQGLWCFCGINASGQEMPPSDQGQKFYGHCIEGNVFERFGTYKDVLNLAQSVIFPGLVVREACAV